MSWSGSNTDVEKQLTDLFHKHGIDCSKPGFCDDPNFLKLEQKDPRFLENYALYVQSKCYEADYLEKAERAIRICAEKLYDAISKDGRLGACVDASTMLSRMLDELGIWSYVTNSTVKTSFPKNTGIKPIWFWVPHQGSGMAAAHSVVVAPPFEIVDLTLKMQPYESGVAQHIPEIVFAKGAEKSQ